MKNYKNDFLIHTNVLTTTVRKLCYCLKKVFILMNIWMIGKNSMELSLPQKEHFYSHLIIEDITDAD